MKKYYLIFLIIWFFCLTLNVLAETKIATGTPTIATPSAAVNEDKDIKNLKEKIATKVAELRKKDQKAVSGVVIDVGDNSLKIKTVNDIEYIIKIDETLTKIYLIGGTDKKEIRLNEIKKGDYIIVTGPVIDQVINANFIYKDEQFIVKLGQITEIDKNNYSLKILTSDKDNYTLDIELYTKQQIMNIKTLEVEKIGFSKIKEGDTIHFVFKNTEDQSTNHFSAQKILIIPQEYFVK